MSSALPVFYESCFWNHHGMRHHLQQRWRSNATHYISLNLWQAQGAVKDEISFSQPLSCVVHFYLLIFLPHWFIVRKVRQVWQVWCGAFRHPERRKTSYVRETLIQSQNQISYGFLYIVSSTFSLNSSLFTPSVSSLCIKNQEWNLITI